MDGNCHVIEIYLVDNGLNGTIPDLKLPYLKRLNLSVNQLSGSIPYFSNLSNLNWLRIGYNQLSALFPILATCPI
jgi:Leucine-rich repeat (LRR) protein